MDRCDVMERALRNALHECLELRQRNLSSCMTRDSWISDHPCPKCGSRVSVTEIDEDHGDIRYECLNPGCDYRGYEDGPDY